MKTQHLSLYNVFFMQKREAGLWLALGLLFEPVWDAPRFVTLGHAWAESQPGVCDRKKLHFQKERGGQEALRGEDRRHWIPRELRRAIAVPCISRALINDLVHALNLLQRQVQIVISKLFHFPRLC